MDINYTTPLTQLQGQHLKKIRKLGRVGIHSCAYVLRHLGVLEQF